MGFFGVVMVTVGLSSAAGGLWSWVTGDPFLPTMSVFAVFVLIGILSEKLKRR